MKNRLLAREENTLALVAGGEGAVWQLSAVRAKRVTLAALAVGWGNPAMASYRAGDAAPCSAKAFGGGVR